MPHARAAARAHGGPLAASLSQSDIYPLVIVADVEPRKQKVQVACLQPKDGFPGAYVIDPEFPGNTGDPKKDLAFCALIIDARCARRVESRPIAAREAPARLPWPCSEP